MENGISPNYIISTDLDGTLLDHHSYAFNKAIPALEQCKHHQVPIIFNTSKTRLETLNLQKQLAIQHPFIVENGSALIIPKDYFKYMPSDCLEQEDYWIKIFGKPRIEILQKLKHILQVQHFSYSGFSDWTTKELAKHTGLSITMAQQANEREYSEPILWQDSEQSMTVFKTKIKNHSLSLLQGGRFIHILGKTNKAKPIKWLKSVYEKNYNKPFKLIALGDSDNDLDMLAIADIAVVIKSPSHAMPEINSTNHKILTEKYGPSGWNDSILNLLENTTT